MQLRFDRLTAFAKQPGHVAVDEMKRQHNNWRQRASRRDRAQMSARACQCGTQLQMTARVSKCFESCECALAQVRTDHL